MTEPIDISSREAALVGIDRMDRELIALLARRKICADYIATTPAPPGAMERFMDFMKDRRAWARSAGLDGDYVDRVFTIIANDYLEQRQARSGDRPRIVRAD